jgi:hypothetical protein
MPRPIDLKSGRLGAALGALLMLRSAVLAADDPGQPVPREVVMKSLDTNLRVDGRVIDTRREFLRFRVGRVKGDWLWLLTDSGTRGWANRRDVIPAGQAVSYFSEATDQSRLSLWFTSERTR